MRLIDVEAPYKIEIELDGKKCHATVTAPTIDAIPVVRCKDCRWQDDDEHCPICNCCGREELPNGEWYCADGERRDDE